MYLIPNLLSFSLEKSSAYDFSASSYNSVVAVIEKV